MNKQQPIFTERTECQDCYKCIRGCPVKAIKIEQGVASVMDDLCIACGTCVDICPAGAKRVRNDRRKVQQLLQSGAMVIASLAPSWISEFQNLPPDVFIRAIKDLGFSEVSETALGAQEVSAHTARLLEQEPPQVWLSSACPVVVEFVRKYHPEHLSKLTGLFSPLLAHSRLLKQHYGEQCKVVFIGPCIAKKNEADDHPDLLAAALTFEDLRGWLDEQNPNWRQADVTATEEFVPYRAEEGVLYPIDGGMIAGVKANCPIHDARCISLSGIENVIDALENIATVECQQSLFIELLACSGGCINGPKTLQRHATIPKRLRVLSNVTYSQAMIPRPTMLPIDIRFMPQGAPTVTFDEEQIRKILRKTGKHTEADELNCGGCGYNSCREFARAVLENKAETSMCVSYMRQLALKKANKLIQTMPSAVVIVDNDLQIIECNRNFARLAGGDAEEIYDIHEGLAGAVLERVLPISYLFEQVLETGEDLIEKSVRLQGRILQYSLFSIERGRIVGGILNDITQPIMKKDEITRRARQVIQDNLKTVQKIAYLLGENASETEMMLTSIIDTFNPDKKR